MKVAILGRTQFLYNTIPLLEQASHEIVIIGTCKASKEYKVSEKDFEIIAKEKNIPFFCTQRINDSNIVALLKEVNADIAISMNWISLIGKDVINCFPYGILNAHPGDLPRYRGNACPNWAIIQGEKQIGVSIHFMKENELDAGNIVTKKYIEVGENTTIGNIYTQLEQVIPNAFIEAINMISEGKNGTAQQGKSLRCYPRKPCDGRIDWSKSVYDIQRLVNASGEPFAGAYTYFGDEKVVVNMVQIELYDNDVLVVPGQVVALNRYEGTISVAAKDGIVKIVNGFVENHEDKKMTEVIISTRERLGYVCEDEVYELRKLIKELMKKK